MEDNSSSDEEFQDCPMSPKLGGKKLKLNDGSSQDSMKESASSSKEKDENVDSGVSADKSESTSSEDRGNPKPEEPSNEVVNVAPSSSNVHTILLNFRSPRLSRNYRKRKTPDDSSDSSRDSDGNDSTRDSDDLSADENSSNVRQVLFSCSDDDGPENPMSDGSPSLSSSSNEVSFPDDLENLNSGDTDSDDEEATWQPRNEGEQEEGDFSKVPTVLSKIRPKHNYVIVREIINRELGLTFPAGKASKSDVLFEQKFYGSLHSIYRLKKLHNLNKHKGCVNSINFHPEGHLLASGSDDMNVVVWDWARNVALQTLKTGHKSNVFQSKFLYLNARSQLNIVTCARDGQVRLHQCPPSGGAHVVRRRLCAHSRAAHKLHVCAREPHVVVSAGEDGLVMQCDVRDEHATKLFHVKEQSATIPLYSVCGHPLDSKQLLVAGKDKFVRVYDRRRSKEPVALYCPSIFEEKIIPPVRKARVSMMHLTCAVYNHDGSEILGSYNDEDIYLFDAKNDVYDKNNATQKDGYTHRYCGHRNSATFKGVAFYGPRSEYIVSGSDCSYIYIWDKETESIVQWLQGDVSGVVNCIEAHPRNPVLATSGLDKDVKIWIPRNHKEPTFDGMKRIVRDNVSSQLRSPLFNDFLPSIYTAWRSENRLYSDEEGPPIYGGNIEFDGNVCTAF